MPLSTTAKGVSDSYQQQVGARVEKAAEQRIAQLKALATFSLRRLDDALKAHFDAADAAGTTPYPVNPSAPGHPPSARISVFKADAFASGNDALAQEALRTLPDLSPVTRELTSALEAAGFKAKVKLNGKATTLDVVVWDPAFREPSQDKLVQEAVRRSLEKK